MLLRKIWLAACVVLISAAQVLAAGKVALVIGNGAYVNATPLPNPTNDASDMTALLQKIGFTVIGGNDLDYAAMGAKIGEFEDAARDADVTLLFYAGHGMQVNGRNFLVPINAKLERESSLQFEAIDAETVLRSMVGPGKSAIAFLDACRDNPLSRRFARSLGKSRSSAVQQGLATPAISGGGMLIGFATAPGDVAADGDGRNSPFTTALLKNMATPGLEIQQLMTRVKGEVFSLTKETQEPWHNTSLRSEVYLVAPDAPASTPEAQPSAPGSIDADAAAEAAWADVKNSKSIAVLEAFVAKHKDSALYLALAQERIQSLSGAAQPSEAVQTAVNEEKKEPANELQPTAPPEQDGGFDVFLSNTMKIVNGDTGADNSLGIVRLLTPAAAPGNKTAKLPLKRTATASSFAELSNKVPGIPPEFDNFTVCRSDFLNEGCAFMSKDFSSAMVNAMELGGLDPKKGEVFRIVQIPGSNDVLFTTSPRAGSGELTMVVGLISPEMQVKSGFTIGISKSAYGISAGDAKTRFEVTGALLEEDDLYLTIDSGLRCKDNQPIERNAGFMMRLSLADLKTKWVTPFNVSNVNMVSDGGVLYTATVGTCAASYIYQIDKQKGRALGRFKLPNGADRLEILEADTMFVHHYPSASVYSLGGAPQ